MPKENKFEHEFFKNHFDTSFYKTLAEDFVVKITYLDNEKSFSVLPITDENFKRSNLYKAEESEFEKAQTKVMTFYLNQSSNYDEVRARNKQEVRDIINKI